MNKYFIAFFLALLGGYSEISCAMEPENVLEKFGFKEVQASNNDQEQLKAALKEAESACCHIMVDQSKIKLNFSPRKKSQVYDNRELLAAIETILALENPNALINTREQAEVLVDKLMVTQLPASKLLNCGNQEFCYVLYRGCNAQQLASMIVFGSAGGKVVDNNTRKPTEEEARRQVGELEKLPEFTTSISTAGSYSKNAFYIAVKINPKYLAEGSGIEKGQVALVTAPVEVIAIRHGRTLI